jgi:hypothetical protein
MSLPSDLSGGITALHQRYRDLAARFQELATRLTRVAGTLAGEGPPPESDLIEALTSARRDFLALQEELQGADGSFDSLATLQQLGQHLQALAENQVLRQRLREELERMQRIVHTRDTFFAPLQTCLTGARECLVSLERARSQAEVLEVDQRAQPFRALWAALVDRETLDEASLELIERAFGSGMVHALTLNRLVIAPESPPIGETLPEPVVPATHEAAPPGPQATLAAEAAVPSATPQPAPEPPTAPVATQIAPLPVAKPVHVQPTDVEIPQAIPALPEPERLAVPPTSQAVAPPVPAEVPEPVEAFTAKDTAIQIAGDIRSGRVAERWGAVCSLTWRLIGDGRTGLASHLAECLAQLAPTTPHLPPDLPRALALSLLMRSSTGDAVEEMRASIAGLQSYINECHNGRTQRHPAGRLLLLALSLRPALLAPGTGARAILKAVAPPDMPGVGQLGGVVLHYSNLNFELNASVLKGVREYAAWEGRLRQLRDEANSWLTRNRQGNLIYAHTTNVWREWLRDHGVLGRILAIVLADQRARTDEVRQAVERWSQRRHVNDQLARTDERLRKGGARQRPIIARAQTAIYEHAQEFVDLAQRWLDLLASEPAAANDFRFRQADECRARIQALLAGARHDVAEFATAGGDSLVTWAAATTARRMLDDLTRLFDPSAEESVEAIPVRHALHRDLLGVEDLPLNDQWSPEGIDQSTLLENLLRLVEQGPFDLHQAFARQEELNNHRATGWILEALRWDGESEERLDTLHRQREQQIEFCRAALRRKIEHTKTGIERAVCYDLVPESQRLDLLAQVESIVPEDVLNFGPEQSQLAEIDQALEALRTQRIAEVHSKLADTTIQRDHPADYGRIQEALRRGDFLTAEEYIQLVAGGQSIQTDAEPTRDVLAEFFPALAGQIYNFLEGGRNRPVRELIDNIRQARSAGPVTMGNVRPKQAEEAAAMLEAWFRLKNRAGTPADNVRELLRALGFEVQQVTQVEGMQSLPHWLADVRTAPLADRAKCLIPQFGSLAEGRYRVLCLYDRPQEQRIMDVVRKASPQGAPVLALYLGRMSEQGRRDLARLCWEQHRSFLLLDESLVFFLCGERLERLPVLCGCAFPFTVTEPYTTTASLVPVEMFFGRDQERESVFKQEGTNLVYGGRQLGKTALLRDVERRYRDLDHGIVVKWIDLKNERIGINRPVEDIWPVIAQALVADKVLPSLASNPDKIAERIQNWLRVDENRRIVLLLDEADAFLDWDSRQVDEKTRHSYPNVSGLKKIMDATNRRFKVVFAGLHNVQRTARDVNSPMGHLGTAVCIGPLLGWGEWRQAKELIELPLRELGFRLEDDLSMRILSHTNYYPSLIQIFCKWVLRRLHGNPNRFFNTKDAPPYAITVRDVEDTYQQSSDLRDEIRDRFNLTLRLDPRYRFIALAIAHASVEQRAEGALVEGFDVAWVREQAMYWWPKGFEKDSSFEMFRTILDEMIGLGVLRKTGGDRYALRSTNVLTLLGTGTQIQQDLLDIAQTAPTPEYEATTFRRTLHDDVWSRSPLTAQQESELLEPANGTAVLFGSEAGGLDLVPKFLREACPAQMLWVAENLTELRAFRARLDQADQGRGEGVFLAVVAPSCVWSAAWVQHAADVLSRKTRAQKNFLRVLFLADPTKTWEWVTQTEDELLKFADAGVRELSLHPWKEPALRRWMLDAGFGPHDDPAGCEPFLAVTGGWTLLVHAVGEKCRESPYNWKDHLDGLEKTWSADPVWRARFGLYRRALPVLRSLAEMNEPLSEVELAAVLGTDATGSQIDQALAWADRLQYVRKVNQGRWQIDPVVQRIVHAANE